MRRSSPVGQLGEETIAGARPGFCDGRRETREGGRIVPAGLVQLLEQRGEDVEFANDAQPLGHLPEPAPKTPRDFRIQFEHGQNFPEAPRRDARAVERAHISVSEAV